MATLGQIFLTNQLFEYFLYVRVKKEKVGVEYLVLTSEKRRKV